MVLGKYVGLEIEYAVLEQDRFGGEMWVFLVRRV